MTPPLRTFLGMLLLTVIAAALAGWLGVQYGISKSRNEPNLDAHLHERLDLSAQQDRQIAEIEKRFADERRLTQGKMRAANHELADAVTKQHVYGPDAERAIKRFHQALLQLQEDTIRHVLAMRAVLSADQAREFDKIIAKALTADPS